MCDSIYYAYTLIFLCIVLYMSFMKRIKMIIIKPKRGRQFNQLKISVICASGICYETFTNNNNYIASLMQTIVHIHT